MLAKGTIIDQRFEIISCLGIGGFGSVYKAQQLGLDRVVALKLLHEILDQGESKARFEREAAILSTLNHKNLALFYGYGYINEAPYMVMEFVAGKTLEELIDGKEHLKADETIEIAKQMCEALQCVHAQGIIHRDLKPNNVIITEGSAGRFGLKLIDFGLALFNPFAGQAAQRLTEAGTTIGTVQFMPPEQCLGEEIDKRSDIYSLGCIIYNCLVGRAPFEGTDCITIMKQQSFDEPPPIVPMESVTPQYQGLLNIIYRAMSKSPEDRFQDSSSMLQELMNLSKLTSVEKMPRLQITGCQARSQTRAKPRSFIVEILAASAAATGVGLFAFQQLSGNQTSHPSETSITVFNRAKEMKKSNQLELAVENYYKTLKLNHEDQLLNSGQVDLVKTRLAQDLYVMARHQEAAAISEDALKSVAQHKNPLPLIHPLVETYTASMQALRKFKEGSDFLVQIKSSLAQYHGEFERPLYVSLAALYEDQSLWSDAKATLDDTPVEYISSPSDHISYYRLYLRACTNLGLTKEAAHYREKLKAAQKNQEEHTADQQGLTRIDIWKLKKSSPKTPDAP